MHVQINIVGVFLVCQGKSLYESIWGETTKTLFELKCILDFIPNVPILLISRTMNKPHSPACIALIYTLNAPL